MVCDCDYILGKRDVAEQHYSTCSTLQTENRRKKYDDGTLKLPNDQLSRLKVDHLYHLGLDTGNFDLPALFGDVKFVCMGGTKHRMREFARYMADLLGVETDLVNLTKASQRFATFKVGPVLAVNHGIGMPSMLTVLQEVIKLMAYSKAKDPVFIRLGSSGGICTPPGSVVVSSFAVSGTLEKVYELPVLGERRKWPSHLDKRLAEELVSVGTGFKEFQTFAAGTMGADDFYRGQGRLDGPLCDYNDWMKRTFLGKLQSKGVRNIEMEANAFAAVTAEAGVRAAIACVTFVDRMDWDQVTTPKATLNEWQKRPMYIVGALIKKYLEKKNKD